MLRCGRGRVEVRVARGVGGRRRRRGRSGRGEEGGDGGREGARGGARNRSSCAAGCSFPRHSQSAPERRGRASELAKESGQKRTGLWSPRGVREEAQGRRCPCCCWRHLCSAVCSGGAGRGRGEERVECGRWTGEKKAGRVHSRLLALQVWPEPLRGLLELHGAAAGSSKAGESIPLAPLPARTSRSSRRRTANAFMCCESSWSRTIEKDGQCVESGTTGTRARTRAVAMRRRDRVRVGYGQAR